MKPVRTALYRHFDAAGRLLYVGISFNSIQRTAQHRHGAHWFESIARIEIEWHPTRAAALAAEAIAIAKDAPAHNIAGRRPAPVQRQQVVGPRFPATRPGLAIRHVTTGRLCGWFFSPREEIEHLLGWWRAVFPRDQFEIVGPRPGGDNYIHRHLELKSINSELWAATEPQYAAGDAWDAAMERCAA